MHGKNNHEIAKAMAIAEETVRVHKLRAIQSLRKRLGANEMLTHITSILKCVSMVYYMVYYNVDVNLDFLLILGETFTSFN